MTRDEVLDVIKLLDAGKNPGRGRVEAVIAWLEDENHRHFTGAAPKEECEEASAKEGWVLK